MIIHRFWTGGPMPARYRYFADQWEVLNPDWRVIDWTEDSVRALDLQNIDIYTNLATYGGHSAIAHSYEAARATQMADVLAYELVNKFGGIYVNCDIQPLVPIDDWPVDVSQPFASYEVDSWINNGVIGGSGDFWQEVIDKLPDSYWPRRTEPMHITTGPHHLTRCARETEAPFDCLPSHAFNYTLYTKIPVGGPNAVQSIAILEDAKAAGALGIHWWGHRYSEARTDV